MIRAAVVAVLLVGVAFAVYHWWPEIRERTKGYRTIVWNGFVAAIPTLLYVLDKLQALDMSAFLSPGGVAISGIGIGLVGMWLRAITTGPVGSKGDEAPAPETKAGD